MARLGLKAHYPKRFKVTTDSNHNEVMLPNSPDRQFNVVAPNQGWTTDITYIWKFEGWLYLAVVIELFSRQVVGWTVVDHLRTLLCVNALKMAFLPTAHKDAENRNLVCSIIQIGVANVPVITTDNICLS
jgi:putative transposase